MIRRPLIQVWDETGSNALGVLTGFETLTLSDVLCDLGSLKLTVPRNVKGWELLDVDADRQVRVSWPGPGGTNLAPPLWYVNDDDQGTWVSDDPAGETIALTGRSLAQVLDEAIVLPPGGVGTTPLEHGFASTTPGDIVATFFAAMQSAGWLQGLTLAGNASVDAAGAAWPTNVPAIKYKAGTSLLAILKGLYSAGLLEWRLAGTTGRTLEIYKAGGGLDRSLTTMLRPRHDVLSAPLTRSRRQISTDVIVEGANSATVARAQTLTGRRRRATYVSETNAPGGSLTTIGDLYLAAHAAADIQMTHDLTDGETTPLPWIDYRPGDRLRTIAAGPGVASRRVAQLALSMTPTETKATLELGSLLKDWTEQMSQEIARLIPGDSVFT